ncbi:MAG: carbohydrate kinase family protein [candidate division KSB1 bacterium]|nr:carbohydrate kinase family protein [candidate division KSB1 bacterium]MDZ7301778.1 carbohydrate kinase family protein [candidate division KSB1 bacterium]MDZ7311443.1 carbohydrate kinase family protein [candidate division KSB1 bacterium]
MAEIDTVVAGHICLDIIPPFPSTSPKEVTQLFVPGKLLKVDQAVLCTGGAVSNTGIALSKLGVGVAYMSKVGNDEFGKIIVDKMSAWGDVHGITRDDKIGSSYSVILAPPSIDRMFLHHPGCNDFFTSQDINWEIVASSRLFHFGYPPIMRALYIDDGREMAKIFARVKALGIATSLDMALPDPESEAGQWHWRKWLETVLPFVDFFVPSIEEALFLWDRLQWQALRRQGGDFVETVPISTYSTLATNMITLGCGAIFLKAGSRGIYAKTASPERLAEISALPEKVRENWSAREYWGASFVPDKIMSAAGAGDSAVAGILTAVLHGKSLAETLQFGNCLGWQNLRALDTVSGIGSYEETEALVKTLTPASCDFLDESWTPSSYSGIWQRQ